MSRPNSPSLSYIRVISALSFVVLLSSACALKLEPPQTPLLNMPAPEDVVRSPIVVAGKGTPSATVEILIRAADEGIGFAETEVDEGGSFEIELSFEDQALGEPLFLHVSLKNEAGESETLVLDLYQASLGNRYSNIDEAPALDGEHYSGMRIYDMAAGEFLDEIAFLEELDHAQVIYFGEQHETDPIHELQLFVLDILTERDPDIALAMEHFQSHKQAVIDVYLNGDMSNAEFRSSSDPWNTYEDHWEPLVEHMKTIGGEVIATNVPQPAIDAIRSASMAGMSSAEDLGSPLDAFNSWGSSSDYDRYVPPRPLEPMSDEYLAYFDLAYRDIHPAHGARMGLSYEQGLAYFSEFSYIRDHTMGYWIADHIENTSKRVFFVGGDWHVQTGLATPDLAAEWSDRADLRLLVTTSREGDFEALKSAEFEGRSYADFILVYE